MILAQPKPKGRSRGRSVPPPDVVELVRRGFDQDLAIRDIHRLVVTNRPRVPIEVVRAIVADLPRQRLGDEPTCSGPDGDVGLMANFMNVIRQGILYHAYPLWDRPMTGSGLVERPISWSPHEYEPTRGGFGGYHGPSGMPLP